MKKTWLFLILGLLAISASAQVAPPAPAAPEIPRSKWFSGGKGYEEARALQQQTGANMIIYFADYSLKNERGLCSWWEQHGINDGKVNKFLRDYIKVKVELPLSKRDEEIFSRFRINKTPAVFIVRNDGSFPTYCPLFNWENDRPKLKEPEELIEFFTKASTPLNP